MIVKAFGALCHVAKLPPLSKVIRTYIVFDLQLIRSNVLSFHVNFFAPIMRSKSLEDVTGPLSSLHVLDGEAYGKSS